MQRRLPQRRLKLRLTRRSEVASEEPQTTLDGSAASSAMLASTWFWRKRPVIFGDRIGRRFVFVVDVKCGRTASQ